MRQELLAVFEAEYRDHLRVVRDILAAGPLDGRGISEIFRRVHSLKGAARVVERADIETIAHALEGRLFRLLDGQQPVTGDDLAAIGTAMDQIDARMQEMPDPAEGPEDGAASPPGREEPAAGYVQVPVSRLDALVGVVHDMMGIAERQERLWADLEDLTAAAARRAGPTTDPAAELARLTRALAALSRERGRIAGQADRAMMRLDEEVRAVTLVPAGTVFGSLTGMVRQIAREHGSGEVTVRLLGMDVRADRRVMQALRDPVIHLLRNAIVHGLESPARRQAEGKPAEPVLTLSVRMLGVRLLVSVGDDGRGPDLEAIAARAVRQGLMQPDEPCLPETLLNLVFAPGFSTRAAADRLSGRGMGLSVVAEAARALQGSVRMEAGAPWGTVVTMAVPVSRRQRTTLVVEAGDVTVGVPGRVIERLARVRQADVRMVDGRAYFALDRRRAAAGGGAAEAVLVPVVPLAAFLGRPDAALPVHDGALSVVVLAMADGGCCGFAVDRMREVRVLHISDADAVGLDSELIPGVGWPRGDRPVFVLNPDTLLERWQKAGGTGGHFDGAEDAGPGGGEAALRRVPVVLVVDDSITTRTLQKTILQTHGYDVLLATDGVEALSLLHRSPRRIDVIVTDVEMPRMDGFALLDAVRSDPRLSRIPVVLMTSRNEEADIRRGLEGGARAYVTKQGFEQGELLDIIRGVL
nr:response regulator [Gluconacetobacter takamatsuzukensis]